jgi:sugar phosphate isomerase/epimerase
MELSFEVWPNGIYEEADLVGVSTNSWGDRSIEWCVDRVAKYGYKGIDFFFDKLLDLDDEEYEKTSNTLGDLVRSKGMEIASLGAHYLNMSSKPWKREPGVAAVKKAIDFAVKVDAKTVVSYVSGYYYPATYKLLPFREAKQIFIAMVRECGQYAAERNIDFCIEPHDSTIINTPDITMKFIDEIGLDNVYVCIDIAGVEIGMRSHMSIEEALDKFGKRIKHVHVKDVTGTIGNWNMCWFGAGLVNFQRYADALRNVGYDGYICVEWEGWIKGGREGVGDTYGSGLADFDRVAEEAKEFLEQYFY